LFKGMALHPAVKKTLILAGKLSVPLAATYGTVKLGVWGTARDSFPVADRVRTTVADASALLNVLPDLGSSGNAVKSAWNSCVGATTGTIIAIPRSIGSGLTRAKEAVFGKKKDDE